MVADALARAVRQQLGLGRLLPLGVARDGAWLTEHAATAVLRAAAAGVPEVRVTALHVDLLAPQSAAEPTVPPPPTALPPGPLRVTGEFLAAADQPLPASAERLRAALHAAAVDGLGLVVGAVDLRVTGLLEQPWTEPAGAPERAPDAQDEGAAAPDGGPGSEAGAGRAPVVARPGSSAAVEARIATAVTGVPGVARLAPALGGLTRPVRVEGPRDPAGDSVDGSATGATDASPAGPGWGASGTAGLEAARHAQVQVAVAAGHRAVEVARAVRAATLSALLAEAPGRATVAVLVTAVETGGTSAGEQVRAPGTGARPASAPRTTTAAVATGAEHPVRSVDPT
ncbi:hypothetical protein [Streptomyces sp. NPDC057702]|uniref:hypothetical protein n=1 Tax=unclassified Streptomyces TaxID=2593676 RepID=UPI0036990FE9